jgi:hypothetical protein
VRAIRACEEKECEKGVGAGLDILLANELRDITVILGTILTYMHTQYVPTCSILITKDLRHSLLV